MGAVDILIIVAAASFVVATSVASFRKKNNGCDCGGRCDGCGNKSACPTAKTAEEKNEYGN